MSSDELRQQIEEYETEIRGYEQEIADLQEQIEFAQSQLLYLKHKLNARTPKPALTWEKAVKQFNARQL